MDFAIRTYDLTKVYGNKLGCEKICLSVKEGQIFGFLGPNGAGKSTLVKMLVGLLKPTSGTAKLLGKPLGSIESRNKIGFLPENFRYHDWLTGRQLLEFHSGLYRLDSGQRSGRIPLVLDLVGLSQVRGQKVRNYSKGMLQRIGMACALLPDPDLLFLDEPTSALDPLGRREVRAILLGLRERGKTIFLNSHLLSEVEMICDEVAIVKGGRIIAHGRPGELASGSIVVELQVGNAGEGLLEELKRIAVVISQKGNIFRVSVNFMEEIPRLAEAVFKCGGSLYRLAQEGISLEETFVSLLQEED